MKKQMFIVDCGTYPFDVLVCVGIDYDDMITFLSKRCTLTDEEKEALIMSGGGRSVILKTGQSVLQVTLAKNKPFFHGNLAHEIFHIVDFLFERVGIKYSDDFNEAYAYQVQYLTEEIYKKLKV